MRKMFSIRLVMRTAERDTNEKNSKKSSLFHTGIYMHF